MAAGASENFFFCNKMQQASENQNMAFFSEADLFVHILTQTHFNTNRGFSSKDRHITCTAKLCKKGRINKGFSIILIHVTVLATCTEQSAMT